MTTSVNYTATAILSFTEQKLHKFYTYKIQQNLLDIENENPLQIPSLTTTI